MNHSKYNAKLDPKHNGQAANKATVEVPSATAALNAKPAVAVVALQPATQVQVESAPAQDLPAPKANGQAAPAFVKADAAQSDNSEAMVSEGAPATPVNAVREPDAVSVDTTTVAPAPVQDGIGEKAPTLLAKDAS